jgi:hypothetical protein
MFRRGTTTQERRVEERRTPVEDIPREGPGPQGADNLNPPRAPSGRVTQNTAPVYDRPGTVREEEVVGARQRPRVIAGWVNTILGIGLVGMTLVLILRLGLKLADASTGNGFVRAVYHATGAMIAPFQGIFANHVIRGGGIYEPANYIALAVYVFGTLLVMGLIALIAFKLSEQTRVHQQTTMSGGPYTRQQR